MAGTKKELFYDTIVDEWEGLSHKVETQKRLKVIFKELLFDVELKKKKFLEVGCGLGYFSRKAVSLGAKVTGIDIGPRLIERCRKKSPNARFIEASVSALPFNTESFDIVLCTEVIEHVEDQKKAFSETYRVLKKGGYLVLTTPNKLFKPLFDLLGLVGIRAYQGNENWLYPWKIKSILKERNYEILKEIYFNFFYPNKFFNYFEKFKFLKYLMINQGYLVTKT
jgi:ubiquinone/menaquinone biosynthesis C-methylase UbiE